MKSIFLILIGFISLLYSTKEASLKMKRSVVFEKMIEDLKNTVVMIDIQSDLQFYGEHTANARATGFVVDAKLGLIATNKHVTRTAPSKHKIKFYDGSVARGTVVYYDFYHDFGFIQLDFMRDGTDYKNNDIYKTLKAVQLGSSYDIQRGEELMLIGNNEGVNYSIKYGNVMELNIPDTNGLGSIIQTSFDRTGGSSGSPVWNKDGKVIAIHAMGDKTASFEVPVEYLKRALQQIIKNDQKEEPFRFDKAFTGIYFTLTPLYKLERSMESYSGTSKEEIKKSIAQIKNSQRNGTTVPEVVQVSSIIQNSHSDGKIKSGDIILKINDKFVGNDLVLYENLLDESVSKDVSITVFRFGTLLTIESFPITSTEDEKINSFIKISNTIIHPINFYVKSFIPLLPYKTGLFISQVGLSPFAEISSNGNIVISSLNSHQLNSLDDLINALDNNCDRTNIYIEAMDLSEKFPRSLSYSIDLGDLQEIYLYEVNKKNGGWTSKAIVLKQCQANASNNSRKSTEEPDKKFYHKPRRMNELRREFLKHFNI